MNFALTAGPKTSRGRKPKRGEAGRQAALEAGRRRKANREAPLGRCNPEVIRVPQLAVKTTNKSQKPKGDRRKPIPPRRAAF